jgi:hypothetical protein
LASNRRQQLAVEDARRKREAVEADQARREFYGQRLEWKLNNEDDNNASLVALPMKLRQ